MCRGGESSFLASLDLCQVIDTFIPPPPSSLPLSLSAVQDTKKCELLVVIGTSLVVHPFASLVDRSVPVGPITHATDTGKAKVKMNAN